MIHQSEIWGIILKHMPRGKWVSVSEICLIVESHTNLDREDYEPEAPGSSIPKWRRNVRNALLHYKRKGEIYWNGKNRSQSEYLIE